MISFSQTSCVTNISCAPIETFRVLHARYSLTETTDKSRGLLRFLWFFDQADRNDPIYFFQNFRADEKQNRVVDVAFRANEEFRDHETKKVSAVLALD